MILSIILFIISVLGVLFAQTTGLTILYLVWAIALGIVIVSDIRLLKGGF